MTIEESRFVYPDEVRMVCDAFGIDPVAAIAEGSLLITAAAGSAGQIITRLSKIGISASVIGTVTDEPATRVMKRTDGTEVPLRVPAQDPFWPVFFEGLG
jgi:hydrogenase maturation factor